MWKNGLKRKRSRVLSGGAERQKKNQLAEKKFIFLRKYFMMYSKIWQGKSTLDRSYSIVNAFFVS